MRQHGIYKVDVRNLVRKYGNGGSLTDVDPRNYAALAAEVEAIGNAGVNTQSSQHHRHTAGLPVHQARNSAQRKPTSPVHTPSRVLTPMHSVSTRS